MSFEGKIWKGETRNGEILKDKKERVKIKRKSEVKGTK
jgi:hypothetical protein